MSVFDQHERGDVLHVERLGDLQVLDLVEEIQQVDVTRVSDRPEHRRDEELPTTAAAVEIDVEQIVVVELDLEPGAAVRNDAEGVKRLAVRMRGHLEGDARGPVQLGDDDALGAVDDERAPFGHHRDLTHVDILILDEVLLAQPELHVQGNRIRDPLAQALELGVLGITQGVGDVLERQALVVGENGENLTKNGLEALRLTLLFGDALLQEVQIGGDLNLDEIRRLDHFAELAEIGAFGVEAVDHENIP